MKKLFISLGILSFLITSGCQDNSIVDPEANEPVDKISTASDDTYYPGSIILEGALNDPYPIGNSHFIIIGQIHYEIIMAQSDLVSTSTWRNISLRLNINADLLYHCTVCSPSVEDEISGYLSEVSEDRVMLADNMVSLLEKTYRIQGREDGMLIKFRFKVSLNRVELNAMWLALPVDNTEATEINHY
jgi:hypothetical protein